MTTRKPYQLLATLCTFVASMAVLPAWAQAPVFTIEQSTSGTTTTFTVRRPDASTYQYVECHTISLSAIAGKHFTEPNGVLHFNSGEYEKTVTVQEKASADIDELYRRYQNDATRTYRFIVHDINGFVLASADHAINYGNAYKFNNNYVMPSRFRWMGMW